MGYDWDSRYRQRGFGNLYLHICAVWGVSEIQRFFPVYQRYFAYARRPHTRRACESISDCLCHDGYDQWLCNCQCCYHRHYYHPSDEENRLSKGICRSGGSSRIDRRPVYAAYHGCCGICDGGVHGSQLYQSNAGCSDPCCSVLCQSALVGSPGGKTAGPVRPRARKHPESSGSAEKTRAFAHSSGGFARADVSRLYAVICSNSCHLCDGSCVMASPRNPHVA